MKIAILSGRATFGLMLFFCCIVLGLLTANPAAAQDNYARIKAPLDDGMNNYAELATILPSEVNVEAYDLKVLNYTEGRAVRASILLNGSMVNVYILYPCQPPQTELEPAALKSMMIASNPTLMQANFSDEPISIGGLPAIWGVMSNEVIAAYQPTNQTAALIMIDGALPMETMEDFMGNMSITLNEGVTPITPGYCPDTTVVSDEASAISTEATEAPVEETVVENPAPSEPVAEKPTLEETVKDNAAARNEKMAADRAAAMAKLEEARAKMKG
jgi:hypothetical protein